MKNTLKILYIFIAGIGVFFIHDLLILLSIIGIHLAIYFTLKNEKKSLRFFNKVKWFVLLIFLVHAFTGENDIILHHFTNWNWTIALSYEGMEVGAIMACKLLAMLSITQVVRFSMKKKEFIQGMVGVGLSKSSAEIIDTIVEITMSEKKDKPSKGGDGSGGGKGKGKLAPTDNENTKASDILFKGKVGNIPKKLLERLNFSSDKFKDNPNASIASAALAITLIRMVKIAPGLPIAAGHKNVLIIPAFIYGINQSKKPFAGLQIGSISGILHFSMGFGKFGPLGILEFTLVGGFIDLMLRLPINKKSLGFLMLLGGLSGILRVVIEIALAYIFGISGAFYAIFLPLIISQISFGIASGFVYHAILKGETK